MRIIYAMFSKVFITNQSMFATLFSKRNLDSIFMLQKKGKRQLCQLLIFSNQYDKQLSRLKVQNAYNSRACNKKC